MRNCCLTADRFQKPELKSTEPGSSLEKWTQKNTCRWPPSQQRRLRARRTDHFRDVHASCCLRWRPNSSTAVRSKKRRITLGISGRPLAKRSDLPCRTPYWRCAVAYWKHHEQPRACCRPLGWFSEQYLVWGLVAVLRFGVRPLSWTSD